MSDLSAFLIALAPVSLFLAFLFYLDSYKLVPPRLLLETLLAGASAGCLSYFANASLLSSQILDVGTYVRYGSPFIEEGLKGLFLMYLIRANRVGFLVDAAICGFSVGTGFAVAETLYYLGSVSQTGAALWLLRGFGAAMMHGGCSAIFSILCKLWGRTLDSTLVFFPSLAIAALLHSFFNHFFLSPLFSIFLILFTLPLLTVWTFRLSERRLRHWLDIGFDTHAQLLRLIDSDEFENSRMGLYLQSLRKHFGPEVSVNMLCYIRTRLVLSMRAKGILLARQNGFQVTIGEDIRQKWRELQALEKSIGRTGRIALSPVLGSRSEEEWQFKLLDT